MSIKWDECSQSFIDDEFNAWSYTGEPGTWKPRIGNPKEWEDMMARKKKKDEPAVVDFDAQTAQDEVWVDAVDWPVEDDIYPDSIYAPKHYVEGRKIEPIDVIEDWSLGFHLGNSLKYVARMGRKDDAKADCDKAIWYLQRYRDLLK